MTRPTWKTKEGKVVYIDEMTDGHLNNTIRFIERTYGNPIGKFIPTTIVNTYFSLLREQKKRLTLPKNEIDYYKWLSDRKNG